MMKIATSFLLFIGTLPFTLAQDAPNFTVTDSQGNEHQLYEDYLDEGKTVFLELFFTSCPPCNAIAPRIQELYVEWGEGQYDVEFISFSDKSFDTDLLVNNYKTTHGLTHPGVGADGGSLIAITPYTDGTFGPFFGTPVFIVISPDRSVQYRIRGLGTNATIQAIDLALANTGAYKPPADEPSTISGNIYTETGEQITGFDFDVTGNLELGYNTAVDETGHFNIETPALTSINIAPKKSNNSRNGISAVDILLLQRHILGIQTLDSPYKVIAADVDQNGTPSGLDIVHLRKFLLLITDTLPNNKSWRFVKADHEFENIFAPSSPPFSEAIDYRDLVLNPTVDFIGIKMGDLHLSSNPSGLIDDFDKNQQNILKFFYKNKIIQNGDYLEISFSTEDIDHLAAFQFALEFDQENLIFESINKTSLKELDKNNFGLRLLSDGIITVNWTNVNPTPLKKDEAIFSLIFKTKQQGNIGQSIQLANKLINPESYTIDEQFFKIQLLQNTTLGTDNQMIKNHYIFPNPSVNSTAKLNYNLSQNGLVEINLIDYNGKIVKQLLHEDQFVGNYIQEFDLSNFTPSSYFLQLIVNHKLQKTVKLIRH